MQINHNIRAMVTQHTMYTNNNNLSKSLEKLSTGLRINRAQDDAAGLAMSEQMRTQIRGLGKAKQNAQDSIAALQIAEGGLAEITNLMQRQRELSVQSANDTLTSTERKYLNDEFQELTNEIGRISKTTDYNGKNMLNWSDDSNTSFGALGNKEGVAQALNDEAAAWATLASKSTNDDLKDAVKDLVDAVSTYIGAVDEAWDTFNTDGKKEDFDESITDAKKDLSDALDDFNDATKDITGLKEQEIIKEINERFGLVTKENKALDSLTDLYTKVAGSKGAASYTLHIGANYSVGVGGKWGNSMTVTYISLNPAALGLATKNIKTQNAATEALDKLDKIIKSVSGARAKLGTFINRLEYTINNLASLEYNTQDAESRIRDTNFATETTNFTKNQIMIQSATSMLAQANSLPQSVLGLLG